MKKRFFRSAVVTTVTLFLGSCLNRPQESALDQIVDIASSIALDGGSFSVDLYFKDQAHPLALFVPNPTRHMEPYPIVQILTAEGSVKQRLVPKSAYANRLHREIAISLLDPQIDVKVKSELKVLDALLLGQFRSFDQVYFPERWKGILE